MNDMYGVEHMVMQRQRNAALSQLEHQYEEALQALDEQLATANNRIRDLQREIDLEKAHSAGMLAQAKELAKRCADDPIMAFTGRINGHGDKEKVLHRDFYNRVFDETLRSRGYSNPENFRG